MVFANSTVVVSSWAWHDAFYKGEISLLDIPAKANRLGVNYVELNDFMLPPGRWSRTRAVVQNMFGAKPSHPKLQRYLKSTIKELKKNLQKHDVKCNSWTIDSDLTLPDSKWRSEIKYILEGARTAVELNASYLRLTIGGNEQMGKEVDELVIRRLKMLEALVEQFHPKLKLVVENHWGLSTNITRFLEIMNQVDQIGICFDPGNVRFEDRQLDWANLAANAEMFHLKIYELDSGKIDQEIEYDRIFSHLAHEYFSGPCVVEFEGAGEPDAAIESVLTQIANWPRSSNLFPVKPKRIRPRNKKASISSFYKPVSTGMVSFQDSQLQ
ncbi:MAG: TIM barrel protein [Chloroflexota bacterium]